MKVITLSIHKNVIDKDDTEDAGPEVQVAEDEYKSNILSQKDCQKNAYNEINFGMKTALTEPLT